MKILVTGGNGFIGAHVVEALGKAGHASVVLGRRDVGEMPPGAVFALADIRDYESVAESVSKVDGVIHLAAMVGSERSIRMPEAFVETNVLGAINVFDACRFFKKPCLYASVGNVADPNLYAISKATAERLALMYNKEHGTRIIVARIFNTYGEGQRSGVVDRLVPSAVHSALQGKPIRVFGDGKQMDDFIYVKDVARIIASTVGNDRLDPLNVWHIGTGTCSRVIDVVEMILRLTGSKSEIVFLGQERPGDGARVLGADPGKFIVPDFAFTPLEVGLKSLIAHA